MYEKQIVELLERIAVALEGVQQPTETDMLIERAKMNRINAFELFGDVLYLDTNADRWREKATDLPVVFTPYGWIVDPDE